MNDHQSMIATINLSPQARVIFDHLVKTGSISAREALLDLGIGGNALTRRIKDLKEAGFTIEHERRVHPATNQRYTRYVLVK
jgi:16S rRNA A1518/A1519 N6-dimethyltransferase RsmA/KsgA/DIM1 with predicted DNA glycosylase/AP lyase activity